MIVNIRNAPYDVFIGRGSKWGNPFPIEGRITREKAIAMYEVYIRRNPRLLADLHELEGKVLGCYCHPLPCHGSILLKLLRERENA